MVNSVMKFNYKDLLTSVKFHVSNCFSGLSYKITSFIGTALLNAVSLQMFQNKMKISQPELLNLAQNLQISKRKYIR